MLFYCIVSTALLAIMFFGLPRGYLLGASADPAATAPVVADGPSDSLELGFWAGLVLYLIFLAATIVPSLAVTVRRMHDRGMSGWWYAGLLMMNFVSIINALAVFGYVALLIVCLLPGQAGPNRWGPKARDPSQASVFE